MELEPEDIKPAEEVIEAKVAEAIPAALPPPLPPPPAGRASPAGFIRRTLAFTIDFIFLNFLYLIPFTFGLFGLYLSKGEISPMASLISPFVSIWLILFIGYFTFFHAHFGQTPAKGIVRIKVVNKEGEPLSHFRALLRSLLSLFSFIFFSLGFLFAIFGKKKQGLHDMLIGSHVVLSQD
jgi:uncharacterized RDD family membrane protein YckC